MKRRFYLVLVSLFVCAATLSPVGTGAASATSPGDSAIGGAYAYCSTTWTIVSGNNSSLWMRCNVGGGADEPTDVRIDHSFNGIWYDNVNSGHSSTTSFTVGDGFLEWKTGAIDFGSTDPFQNGSAAIEVLVNGTWQPVVVEGIVQASSLVDPGAPDGYFEPAAPPGIGESNPGDAGIGGAYAFCSTTWMYVGSNTSSLWMRCSVGGGADEPTDVRIDHFWNGDWYDNVNSGHSSTTSFTVGDGFLEWKTGAIDFGSTDPFQNGSAAIEVLVNGTWQPALVQSFVQVTAEVEPGTPENYFDGFPPANPTPHPAKQAVDLETVMECLSTLGGDLFFDEPTYVPSEDQFLAGCYTYEECSSDLAWWLSGPFRLHDWIAETSCAHNSSLLSTLDAIGTPYELVLNSAEQAGGFLVGGSAVATIADVGPPPPTTAPQPPPPEVVPNPGGGPPWVRVALYAVAVSGTAYYASEWLTPENEQANLALSHDPAVLQRVADRIDLHPQMLLQLSPEEEENARRTAAWNCLHDEDLLAEAQDALAESIGGDGFNQDGDHVCEGVNIFMPGSFWVTAGGNVRITVESTQQDADVISQHPSLALLQRVPTNTNPAQWYLSGGVCTPVDGSQCDEYPYRSTSQGGPANYALGLVDVRLVSAASNQGEGNALSSFYGAANGCDIQSSPRGAPTAESLYFVSPMPGASAPGTMWVCSDSFVFGAP